MLYFSLFRNKNNKKFLNFRTALQMRFLNLLKKQKLIRKMKKEFSYIFSEFKKMASRIFHISP